METIDKGLKKYVITPNMPGYEKEQKKLKLLRDITEEDLVRLTEIRIKRISKFNTFKADEEIAKLKETLETIKHHLANLTEYAIAYFETLLSK